MLYLQLFWEFFKTGLFAVGGGLATLPFLQDMADRTGWFTHAQLADMLAVSESTPGPIGVNMATYVGFTTGGVGGALVATLGLVAPSVIVILIVAAFLKAFRDSKWVNAAFYGLRPASTALVAAAGVTIAHGGRSHPAAPAGKTHVPQIELQVAGALGHKKFHTPHAVPHTDLQLFFPLHQRMGGEEGNMSGTQEGVRRFVHQAERGRGGALAGPDRPGYGDKTHARQQERGPQQAERDTTVSGCLLLHHPVPDFPSQ